MNQYDAGERRGPRCALERKEGDAQGGAALPRATRGRATTQGRRRWALALDVVWEGARHGRAGGDRAKAWPAPGRAGTQRVESNPR